MSLSVDVVQTGWSATQELVFLECQQSGRDSVGVKRWCI